MLPPPKFLPRPLAILALLLLAVARPAGVARAQTASQVYTQGVDALNQGDTNGAKLKLQQALKIDPNFRPATALLARMAADQRHGAAPLVGLPARTLERMVVPVEFSNTTLDSAIEFIRQKVAEQTGGKLQINFAVNLPPEYLSKRITLKMDHVPVMEVLRYMGEQTGVQFEKQQYAIAVTPAVPKAAANPVKTAAPAPGS